MDLHSFPESIIRHTINQLLRHWVCVCVLSRFSRVGLFVTCPTLCLVSDSLRLYIPWNSPGQNSGVGRFSLLQGTFPTQGSNPGLSHSRQILYQLSHQGSPKTYPLSRGSSRLENRTQVSCRQILYQLSYQGTKDAAMKGPACHNKV